jgi:hypothetical protein
MESTRDQRGEAEAPHLIVEAGVRLSRSRLWELQRHYFDQQGIRAWSQHTVPHYITSNPFIAGDYARVIFGFLRDCHGVANAHPAPDFAPLDLSQPVYIIELGSGSGRFAFHLLKKLTSFYPRSVLKDVPFKFVMTDFTEHNLDYWRAHPSLRYFVEQGVLDFARFDAEQSESLTLDHSGDTLAAGAIKNPVVVLANYFFDGIPQDAFYIRDGQLYESLVTISAPPADNHLDDPGLLDRIEISYENYPTTTEYYGDQELDRILQGYQQRLPTTYLLFPSAALGCIRRLQHLAGGRLLLISADKGYIHEESLINRAEPRIAVHGSFSMMVNYHAIAEYIRHQGGRVLQTAHRRVSLTVCAFLLGQHPAGYVETRLAFEETIEKYGPDDFFTLKKGIEKNYAALTLEQLLALLRLSGWDAAVFMDAFAALLDQVESADEALQRELHRAIRQVWDNYYHIGERRDIAFYMAMLLYGMEYYPEALNYFQHSLRLYGPDASTFYNMAVCHYALRQLEAALDCINQTLAFDPAFEAAKGMRIKIEAEISQRTRQSPSR